MSGRVGKYRLEWLSQAVYRHPLLTSGGVKVLTEAKVAVQIKLGGFKLPDHGRLLCFVNNKLIHVFTDHPHDEVEPRKAKCESPLRLGR